VTSRRMGSLPTARAVTKLNCSRPVAWDFPSVSARSFLTVMLLRLSVFAVFVRKVAFFPVDSINVK